MNTPRKKVDQMAKKKVSSKPSNTKTPQKPKGIEARFVDILDIDNPTIVTLYGRPGSGKTTIACTGPKPQLLIDVKDKGTDSGKRPELERGDITVIELEGFDDMYDIHEYILDNPDKFKSVVIDHTTALQDMAIEKVKEDEGKDKVSQQMFGFASSYMKEVIALYKDLTDIGISPIFLSEDRLDNGEGDGEDQLIPEVGPALMPSVAKMLCAASRVIGQTYQYEKVTKLPGAKVDRTVEYRLRLGPNPYYITKVTRPPGTPCPAYIPYATYQDIMDIIKGKWKDPDKIKKKGSTVKKKLSK